MTFSKKIILIIIALVMIASFAQTTQVKASGQGLALPSLPSFITSLRNADANSLRGIYIANHLAAPIVQQPMGNPWFVSPEQDTLTQFSVAAEVGNIGLLAHNYLAGADFEDVDMGDTIILIYGDGHTKSFKVTSILRYRAVSPLSPWSTFEDLSTNKNLTAEQLFNEVYRGDFHVTLQTCIEKNGDKTWGRLFIIAIPFESERQTQPIAQYR